MENSGELREIRERLGQLERENAHLRTAGVGLLVAVVAAFVLASKWSHWRSEVAAERFVLKDRTGMVRGYLGMERDGVPALVLFDGRKFELAALRGYSDSTSTLNLASRGLPRVTMTASPYGPSVNLIDPAHGPAAVGLYLKSNGAPGLTLQGESRAMEVALGQDGSAGLNFKDDIGHSLGKLEVKSEGPPELRVVDGAGRVVSRSSLRGGILTRRAAGSSDAPTRASRVKSNLLEGEAAQSGQVPHRGGGSPPWRAPANP
jgi:hypothetical protein